MTGPSWASQGRLLRDGFNALLRLVRVTALPQPVNGLATMR